MSYLYICRAFPTTILRKLTLILFSSLGLLLSATSAVAQVVADPTSPTQVDLVGDQFNITEGVVSSDEANLFHSFEQFDITESQTANFITTDSISNVIGKIKSSEASNIHGMLQISGSEASLYLLNPAGILIGADAKLNLLGGFTATTAESVSFEDGGEVSVFQFNEPEGAVVNQGSLSVSESESIGLIGGSVINDGTLSAPQGSIAVIAVEGENTIRLRQSGHVLSLEMERPYTDVGTGNLLDFTTMVGLLTGGETSQANALVTDADGAVRLSGLLDVVGDTGGSVHVLGNQIALVNASLDASGDTKGGLVQVGGRDNEEGPVPDALRAWVDENSIISADAVESGNGGNIVVRADDRTEYHGQLAARGGTISGNGGSAEVAGNSSLSSTGSFDLSAGNGELGTLVLGATHIEITDGVSTEDNADVYTSNYIESVSDNSNVIWSAYGNIKIHDISNDDLEFDSRRSVAFITDADNYLGGEFEMGLDDTIVAERGNITIYGEGIVIGTIDTGTDVALPGNGVDGGNITLNSSEAISAIALRTNGSLAGDVSVTGTEISIETIDTHTNARNPGGMQALSAGSVELTSDGSVVVEEILTYSELVAPASNAADGGDVSISAGTGDIVVEKTIRTDSSVEGRTAGSAGSIALFSRDGNISIGTGMSGESAVLLADSQASTYESDAGGAVNVIAERGSVNINGDIVTRSQDQSLANNASNDSIGEGGDVVLTAFEDIVVRDILTGSISRRNNAAEGGGVEITAATGQVIAREIITGSTVEEARTAEDGGAVTIEADSMQVEAIDTGTISVNNNTISAGAVDLRGRSNVSIGEVTADSSGGRSSDISIVGDQISLMGGAESVSGRAVSLRPFTRSQPINIGNSATTDSLDITSADLAAIDTSTSQVSIGHLDEFSLGSVTISESAINTAGTRPTIEIVGSETLIGPTLTGAGTTNFLLTGYRTGQIEDADIQFSDIKRLQGGDSDDVFLLDDSFVEGDFEQISGGGGFDIFTYQNMQQPPATVDLSQLQLRHFEQLIGPDVGAALAGEDRENLWEIEGADSGNLNGMMFDNFNLLIGGEREDIFNVENLSVTTPIIIDGGDYLTNGGANNRIVAGSDDIIWELFREDAGRLIQGNSTVNFSSIQHLESVGSLGEDVTAFFLQTIEPSGESINGSITGSINSGNSSLSLIGESSIDIGENSGSRQTVVAGKGTLTIRPEDSEASIILGGNTVAADDALTVSDRILAIGPNSFSDLVVGNSEQTGQIVLNEDISTESSILLRSQGDITTAGSNLTSLSGGIVIDSEGAINAGSINSNNSGVVLEADRAVMAEAVRAGGEVNITSGIGSVSIQDYVDTSDDDIGHDISIEAKTDIVVGGLIDTSGGDRAGNVSLRSSDGRITTAGIVTATGNDSTDESGQVNLSSLGNIQIEFIDARGSSSNTRTNINIDTQDSVVVSGAVPNSGASIIATGADRGGIQITYGNQSRPVYDFSISRQNIFENSRESVDAGISYLNVDLDSIELVNRGVRSNGGIRNNINVFVGQGFEELEEEREKEETFMLLDTSIGEEFSRYLRPTGTGLQPAPISLAKVRKTLEDVEKTTGEVPALVYICFVPSAASEESVGHLAERQLRPDDQLEVILVTQSGQPIIRRQWGVTRAQVEAVGQELRRQIGNPFSKRSQYLGPAQQLHNWIMAPIVQDLEAQQVDSIGFVLDTGLRTLPLATLHDGDHYLVEDYSIGLMPTFSLTNFGSNGVDLASFSQTNVLAMGASEFEQQPDLPAVTVELDLIADDLWQGKSFLNEAFILDNLSEQIQSNQYGVVHLATHANFDSDDLEGSYIQLWNERLSLADVDNLNLSDADIELIVLSACNTALGDAASEYGFAGFAINAGAPSALASLWPVSDEGTLGFMSQFYSYLRSSPIKAEALRAAQVRLLNAEVGIEDGKVYGPDESSITYLPSLELSGRWDFSHPFYWSAFTMVGNPW
ncbi:MAG: CHAT domain-containing protein [Cyanobacteria bacterium P01_D01_bin.1]